MVSVGAGGQSVPEELALLSVGAGQSVPMDCGHASAAVNVDDAIVPADVNNTLARHNANEGNSLAEPSSLEEVYVLYVASGSPAWNTFTPFKSSRKKNSAARIGVKFFDAMATEEERLELKDVEKNDPAKRLGISKDVRDLVLMRMRKVFEAHGFNPGASLKRTAPGCSPPATGIEFCENRRKDFKTKMLLKWKKEKKEGDPPPPSTYGEMNPANEIELVATRAWRAKWDEQVRLHPKLVSKRKFPEVTLGEEEELSGAVKRGRSSVLGAWFS